ncbi:MAG: hypothetical protein ACREK8_10790 [Gemmatimonadales bacterium]
MAKGPITGWIHEPLSALLGTRGKVAALRILWRASVPLPFREVVRRSGMAYRSIDLALGELIAVGIVEEEAGAGRERRVRLSSGHRLAAPLKNLLQMESDHFAALRVELRAVATALLADGLLAASLVGGIARRTERLGSDVEVVLIARDAAAERATRQRFTAALDGIRARYGVTFHLIAYDLATARTMWQTRTAAAMREVRDAEHLAGSSLSDVLAA